MIPMFHQHLTYFIYKTLNVILYSCWSYSFICRKWLTKRVVYNQVLRYRIMLIRVLNFNSFNRLDFADPQMWERFIWHKVSRKLGDNHWKSFAYFRRTEFKALPPWFYYPSRNRFSPQLAITIDLLWGNRIYRPWIWTSISLDISFSSDGTRWSLRWAPTVGAADGET